MLFIYQSNNSKNLLKKSLEIIKNKPLKNPLEKEIFLVEHQEIEKWIKISISYFSGICANINFLSINNFIKKIFIKINPNASHQYFSNKKIFFWKIMKLKNIDSLSRYKKEKKNEEKILELSYKLYKLFHKYDIYRPDLIESWNNNLLLKINDINSIPIQKWQKKIWRKIVGSFNKKNNTILNYLNLENLILKNKKKIKERIEYKRIFVFDTINISNTYINTLYKFSKFYDIYMFVNSPFYISNKNFSKIKKNKYEKPFVLNFGKNGIDHIEYLLKIKKKEYFYNLEKENKNKFLQKVQNKILKESNFKKKNNNEKISLNSTDDSISIHICYSIQQEIETLHFNLLKILKKNKKINFNNILVVAKNIKIYIPYIHGVFNQTNQIPFTISNYFNPKEKEILKIIKSILNLKRKKITYEEFFSLLEIPLISEKFSIDTKNIFELKKCIQELGIKFGINKKNLKKEFNIDIKYNNWKFGINRILLGYSMNKNVIWNSTLSYEKIKKNIYKEIIQIKIFLSLIEKWKKTISQKKKIENWYLTFEEFMNDFLPKRYKEKKIFLFMNKKWKLIIDNALNANYDKKISLEILIKIFLLKKTYKNHQSNLFEGKVNFCNLNSIENITSDVIYLLGMNKDNNPMEIDTEYFDLIKTYPKKGDLNTQKKDLYNFLKIILNAKKYLLISYSIQENKKDFDNCSFMIKELQKYLQKSFYIKKKITNKKNKNIIKKISFKYSINPFLEKENINLKNSQINNNLWIKKLYKEKNNTKKIKLSKLEIKSINFKKFMSFWKHPIKFLFNHRLNIYFSKNYRSDLNNEPFEINFINSYLIKKNILKYLIYKKNIKQLFKNYQLSGLLPNKKCAKYYWEKYVQELYPLYKKVSLLNPNKKKTIFELKIKNFKLYNCTINETENNNLIAWKPKIINIIDGLSFWLKHLIYCIYMKPKKISCIFGIKNTSWMFPILEKKKARNYLLKYIKGYIKGNQKPIFLIKSGFLWLQKEATINLKKEKKSFFDYKTSSNNSKNILLNTWNGNPQYYGEKNDLYIKKIISKLDKKNIHKICNSANKWGLPLLKNKILK
ncbi:RecBCD enzyme subunit RecC [Buchnera aphidicola (Tetraneura ulmi)]|uniref:exodeoxyribonuclease V subunit gamma n=1 Tax=Buchnera aphidicola TaxID=9 RepID=UPI003464BDCA